MSGLPAIVLGVSAAVALTNSGSPAVTASKGPGNAQPRPDRLEFSAVRGVDYDYVHFYPEIEGVIRAHVRPDGPSVEGIGPITHHHMRGLASLSIREQTIPNFLLFASSPLDSLRLYSCRIKDFATIKDIAGIKELHLRGCEIRNLPRAAWPVTYLSLANNEIEDITALGDCEPLQWLDLHDNQIRSISPLKALHKLAYVDLHYNPLDPEAGAVILAIKANNPGVQILAGQEPRVTKEDRREQLSARAEIAEFARCVRWRYEDGVAMPMIPGVTNGEELPDKTAKALLCLMKSQDKEYLADLAAIFVKYAIEIEEHYTPGPVWDPERPLLRAFLQGVDLKVGDEAGIPALVLGHWVLGHRDKLAPSVFLDVQIAKYGKLLKDYSDARNGVR